MREAAVEGGEERAAAGDDWLKFEGAGAAAIVSVSSDGETVAAAESVSADD